MSKSELQSSREHDRWDFANGAAERKKQVEQVEQAGGKECVL